MEDHSVRDHFTDGLTELRERLANWVWASPVGAWRVWGWRPWMLPIYSRSFDGHGSLHLHQWQIPTSVITDDKGRWTNVRWLMEARECEVDRELRTRPVRRLW